MVIIYNAHGNLSCPKKPSVSPPALKNLRELLTHRKKPGLKPRDYQPEEVQYAKLSIQKYKKIMRKPESILRRLRI